MVKNKQLTFKEVLRLASKNPKKTFKAESIAFYQQNLKTLIHWLSEEKGEVHYIKFMAARWKVE